MERQRQYSANSYSSSKSSAMSSKESVQHRANRLIEEEKKKDLDKVSQSETEQESDDSSEGSDEDEDIDIKARDLIFHPESLQRKWLVKHGKEHCLDFSDDNLRSLRKVFGDLDDDGSGSIGVDELEDPLIALGLVNDRSQVQKLVAEVDSDGSEMIEFDEFLDIIKSGRQSAKSGETVAEKSKEDQDKGAIFEFFERFSQGGYMKEAGHPEMPFSLVVTNRRRRMILDAMGVTTKDDQRITRGKVILENYKKQLGEQKAREKVDKGQLLEGGSKSSRLFEYDGEGVPDPETLNAILNRGNPHLEKK